MIINKEGKLFGKVSIIDILAVLAILAAAFGIYTRFTSTGSKVETFAQKIEYTMVIKSVRQGTVDALSQGGRIFDATTKEELGEIIDVKAEPAMVHDKTVDGHIVKVETPNKFDVTVTVNVDGKVNDSGYYTSTNATLTAGSKHVFCSKYAKTTGEIMTVNEVKEVK